MSPEVCSAIWAPKEVDGLQRSCPKGLPQNCSTLLAQLALVAAAPVSVKSSVTPAAGASTTFESRAREMRDDIDISEIMAAQIFVGQAWAALPSCPRSDHGQFVRSGIAAALKIRTST